MLVMNALPWKNCTQVGGKYFDFGPGQIKAIHNENLAYLMITNKAEEGFVPLPEFVAEDRSTPEAKEAIEAARVKGVQLRIGALRRVIDNLEVSLRRDLEMRNIKGDHLSYASKGELEAYKQLAELQAVVADNNTLADEIRAIKEKLSGDSKFPNAE